jgi:hypothetical protein
MIHNIYAFESWNNGPKTQLSAMYEGKEAEEFIENHSKSGTFAQLHVYYDDKEASDAYESMRED